jgi:hypothetical protein
MAPTAEQLYANRCGEILGLVESEPGWSNKELAESLCLSYHVVQSTTARMEKEKLIVGTVVGSGMYTKIEWRKAA